MLPTNDTIHLTDRYAQHSVIEDNGMICVLVPDWKVPPGYQQTETDLLLRLAPGYPDVAPDMWWCNPGLVLADGRAPQATEHSEIYLNRTWQRWSRHFLQPGQWRSGVDCLESYFAKIKAEMSKATSRAA